MQKYYDVVQNKLGLVVEGAKVLITDSNGSVASIYSNNTTTPTPQTNPMTTDSLGRFSFYAADGRYNLKVTIDNVDYGEVRDILLNDPADPSAEKIDGGIITNSQVNSSEVNDSTIVGGTAEQVDISSSTMTSSQVSDSDIDSSTITNSALTNVTIDGETPAKASDLATINARIDGVDRTHFESVALNAGYTLAAGSFEDGATITSATQVLLDESTKKIYAWVGTIPGGGLVVTAGTDPTSNAQWVDKTVVKIELGSYAAIRSYSGKADRISCTGRANVFDEAYGLFMRDDSDTSTEDDDGTVLVDALGRRWKRQYSGAVNVRWYGAIPSDDTADTAIKNRDAFRRATLSMKSAWDSWRASKRSRSVYVPGGDYNLSNGFCVPKGCAVFSDGLGVARLKILTATADAANKLPLVSLGRVINDSTLATEVSTGAYVDDPAPFIDQLYLNPQNSNTAVDVSGIPGFKIGTLWVQANKGVVITGGSGDGIIGNIFAEDSTGYGIEFGDCQNITVDNLYSFLCNNPLIYSGSSNNTRVNNLQANYTKIATVQTLDGVTVRGAKIGCLVSKHNVQYGTFTSVVRLRSTSCDLKIGEMDARNHNGYAINNETGLGNVVQIGFLRLRQASFSSTDTAGVAAKGCRVNNMTLLIDEIDIAELGFSPFEVTGTFASKLTVTAGNIGGLNATVPVCDISNTSTSSRVELQVEPPSGLALFNLQSVISPIYDRVRRPFPIVSEGGRQAIKIPFTGNANSWRVSITANTNPAGNAAYRRCRRLFVAQETGFNSALVSNLAAVDDGNTGLTTTFSPDVAYQLDIDSVGGGSQKAFAASGYAVISVPSNYNSLSISLEQMR